MAVSGKDVRAARLAKIAELESCGELSPDGMTELGALYYADGRNREALNMFYGALDRDPGNVKARGYVQLLREVLDYVNKDLMNP